MFCNTFVKKFSYHSIFWILNIFTLFSCAKIEYLWDQGEGQLRLQNKAKKNQEVLKSPRVSSNDKEKIRLIDEYKKYFYQYFSEEETNIYSRTTFLKNKAVSYLVIASPYDRIQSVEHCFPFMGCFPYLGFFDAEKAKDFQRELEKKEYATYLRPVFAYSTLGYFEDTILSSFFQYDETELAELIFHELFHTIFFIKNEIDLNENLANYVSEKMAEEYFLIKGKLDSYKSYKDSLKKLEQLNEVVVKMAIRLQELYDKERPMDKVMAKTIFEDFLQNEFLPKIKNKCLELNLKIPMECYPIQHFSQWNNARFAAFLTYEKSQNLFLNLQNKFQLNLKSFLKFMRNQYEIFSENQNNTNESFEMYLSRLK